MTDPDRHTLRRRTVLKLAGLGVLPGSSLAVSASHRQGVFPLDADTTDRGDATVVAQGSGDYDIEAAGHDVWTDADEYGAVYLPTENTRRHWDVIEEIVETVE